jgi:hypothetical protein
LSNLPTEPGLYLAKSRDSYKWRNLVVEVNGEAPFLRIAAWDRDGGAVWSDTRPIRDTSLWCDFVRIGDRNGRTSEEAGYGD